MALEKFKEWYENRHAYQKDWKARTGGKIVGYFCTSEPVEIFYAFDVLPVRILGSHEFRDVTEAHLFGLFCPFCRDVLSQGLKGTYDYLDGITIGESCLQLRQAFSTWELHKKPGWSHYLPMPSHMQGPKAVPFLQEEYRLLIKKLENLTGRTIGDDDLRRGIKIMNKVRRVTKDIYEFRKADIPPITGEEIRYITCSQFFTDAREWLPVAEALKVELKNRKLDRAPGKRLMLLGSEDDDLEFVRMVENLGEEESQEATVVIEEHCTTTGYFGDEVELNGADPLTALAERYLQPTSCPSKDRPDLNRVDRILKFAKDFRVDGAIVIRQKFCDAYGAGIPFVQKALEENGVPACFLEFDETTVAAPFAMQVETFLKNL